MSKYCQGGGSVTELVLKNTPVTGQKGHTCGWLKPIIRTPSVLLGPKSGTIKVHHSQLCFPEALFRLALVLSDLLYSALGRLNCAQPQLKLLTYCSRYAPALLMSGKQKWSFYKGHTFSHFYH
jgi:hypothetical protein